MSQTHAVEIRERAIPTGGDALPATLSPLLRRIYLGRGVTRADELDYRLNQLPRPDSLKDVGAAGSVLADAITGGQRILVVGDFDADGATSTALAVRALRAMGAVHVDYLVPNRFRFGYGLTPELVEVARDHAPDLILTVDNGVSAHAGVAAARALGIDVVITDHHLPGESVPEALAIVNPHIGSADFDGRHLAGVGVCFYTMLALRAALRERGWFGAERPEPGLVDNLDLVALGTVADVVPLDRVNRLLVEQGLRRIRAGQATPGVLALLNAADRDPERISAIDLGFGAAPRLNAAGRLDDMSRGIETLLARGQDEANAHATSLEALNRERRMLEREMRETALADIEAHVNAAAGEMAPILCLVADDWHQGVVGIVASRLKERFRRPVVAFAPADNGELKGSARSVPGLHMRDLFEALDTRSRGELILRFGGHAMAAGLTLRSEDFAAFKAGLTELAREWLGDEPVGEALWTDGIPAPQDYCLETASMLRYAGPWGAGFPEPVFHDRFLVRGQRIVGADHLKLRLSPLGAAEREVEAIAFNAVDNGFSQVPGEIEAVFRLDVNRYRGVDRLQLVIDYLAAA
ncbi:single-stranded-DNA-specific exonuclease RecJ [Spiribacter insolitus]|uniref:Single-stranded-DNA-specific exonuclease RecJ n=1 Tax=Spiribacter insolitus TaxID=3122417 RepID=A0ABV3T5N3_9GAMM